MALAGETELMEYTWLKNRLDAKENALNGEMNLCLFSLFSRVSSHHDAGRLCMVEITQTKVHLRHRMPTTLIASDQAAAGKKAEGAAVVPINLKR